MIPDLYRVVRTRKENSDTFTLALRPEGVPPPASPPPFQPGQFNMLYAFGLGESAISVSGDPGPTADAAPEWVHTIRAVGMVTEALTRLPVGGRVGVRGPFGTGWPLARAEGYDVLLVAGGIGLAPLRSALLRIAAERGKFGRVTLLYGARTPNDLIFQNELRQLQRRSAVAVEITVDHGQPGWNGHVGVVPALISRISLHPSATIAMICGPEVMMRFTVEDLSRLGVPDHAIYLSMERNMRCAVGSCGHCQFMPFFICKDGPVFRFDQLRPFFGAKEV